MRGINRQSAYMSLESGYKYASSFKKESKSAYQSLQDGYKEANKESRK